MDMLKIYKYALYEALDRMAKEQKRIDENPENCRIAMHRYNVYRDEVNDLNELVFKEEQRRTL